MVVDTEFTKSSGHQGAVPMFSRVGRQTIAEDLTFQDQPGVVAQSTFEIERQRHLEGKQDEEDLSDDEADIQDFEPEQKEAGVK